MLCRRTADKTKSLYAMKTMRKATLAKRDQIANAATERHILQNINNPFLMHLVYAFQTPGTSHWICPYKLVQT